MAKTFIATIPTETVRITASKKNGARALLNIAPEMFAINEVADNKFITVKNRDGKTQIAKKAFVFMSKEKVNYLPMTYLVRLAPVGTEQEQDLFNDYTARFPEGEELSLMKGRSKKAIANNEIIKNSKLAEEHILSKGFHTIISLDQYVNGNIGGGSKRFPKGESFEDVFFVFAIPSKNKGFVNYKKGYISNLLKFINNHVEKLQASDVAEFLTLRNKFLAKHEKNIQTIKNYGKAIAELKEAGADKAEYQELANANAENLAIAEDGIDLLLRFSFITTAKGGNIRLIG